MVFRSEPKSRRHPAGAVWDVRATISMIVFYAEWRSVVWRSILLELSGRVRAEPVCTAIIAPETAWRMLAGVGGLRIDRDLDHEILATVRNAQGMRGSSTAAGSLRRVGAFDR